MPEAIRDLNARLGLPSGLAAMDVEQTLFDRIISGAPADHCHKTNPRIATADEYRQRPARPLRRAADAQEKTAPDRSGAASLWEPS